MPRPSPRKTGKKPVGPFAQMSRQLGIGPLVMQGLEKFNKTTPTATKRKKKTKTPKAGTVRVQTSPTTPKSPAARPAEQGPAARPPTKPGKKK